MFLIIMFLFLLYLAINKQQYIKYILPVCVLNSIRNFFNIFISTKKQNCEDNKKYLYWKNRKTDIAKIPVEIFYLQFMKYNFRITVSSVKNDSLFLVSTRYTVPNDNFLINSPQKIIKLSTKCFSNKQEAYNFCDVLKSKITENIQNDIKFKQYTLLNPFIIVV